MFYRRIEIICKYEQQIQQMKMNNSKWYKTENALDSEREKGKLRCNLWLQGRFNVCIFRGRTAFCKLSLLILKWIWINYEYFVYRVSRSAASGEFDSRFIHYCYDYQWNAYNFGMIMFMIMVDWNPIAMLWCQWKQTVSTFDYCIQNIDISPKPKKFYECASPIIFTTCKNSLKIYCNMHFVAHNWLYFSACR